MTRAIRNDRLAAALALLFAQASVHGADLTQLPLERLMQMRVVAASSYEQEAAEAPSSVSVITAEDIRNRGFRTLAEALASLPGMFVTDDLAYLYLGSRGFNRIGDYNSRFQVLVNGLRTNDALYDMAYLDAEFPLDMGLIERIEFAPGPGSSLYGGNAMLGVVNIVTHSATALEGLRITAGVGSYHLRDFGVSFGKRYDNGLEVLASVSGLRDSGQDFYFPAFDSPATNNGIASGQNGQRTERGYLRLRYGDFDFEAFGSRRRKGTPSAGADSDFLCKDDRIGDKSAYAALRYQRNLAPHTTLEARANVASYEYLGVYNAASGPAFIEEARGAWSGAELRLVSTVLAGHKIVAGADVQDGHRLDQEGYDATQTYLDRHDRGRRTGLYIQDEFRFMEGWLLSAGLRHDRDQSFGSSTSPRLALIGEIAPGTTLKLIHGAAFRAPNAYELFYESPTFASSDVLRPEKVESNEAVIEHQLGPRSRWRASLYQYTFRDLIEQVDEDGMLIFRNRGTAKGRGVELSAALLLPAQARLDASAFVGEVHDGNGRRLNNAPRYTARVALQGPLAGSGVNAALDVGVVGPRLDLSGGRVGTNVLTNLVLTTREPWHGATFSFGMYNLLDRRNPQPVNEYFASPQLSGLGRNVRFSAEWRY